MRKLLARSGTGGVSRRQSEEIEDEVRRSRIIADLLHVPRFPRASPSPVRPGRHPAWAARGALVRIDVPRGGCARLGGVLAMACFASSRKQDWLAITDFIAPLVPLGLGAGRLGNFINAELWGRAASVPWGTGFPTADRVAG